MYIHKILTLATVPLGATSAQLDHYRIGQSENHYRQNLQDNHGSTYPKAAWQPDNICGKDYAEPNCESIRRLKEHGEYYYHDQTCEKFFPKDWCYYCTRKPIVCVLPDGNADYCEKKDRRVCLDKEKVCKRSEAKRECVLRRGFADNSRLYVEVDDPRYAMEPPFVWTPKFYGKSAEKAYNRQSDGKIGSRLMSASNSRKRDGARGSGRDVSPKLVEDDFDSRRDWLQAQCREFWLKEDGPCGGMAKPRFDNSVSGRLDDVN